MSKASSMIILRRSVLDDSVLYLWRRAVYLMSSSGHGFMIGQNLGTAPRIRGLIATHKNSGELPNRVENYMSKALAVRLIRECGCSEIPLLPDNNVFEKIKLLLEGVGIAGNEETKAFLGRDIDYLRGLEDRISLDDLDDISWALGIAPGVIVHNWYSKDLILSRSERIDRRLEFFQITEDEFRGCIKNEDFEAIENIRMGQIPRNANSVLIKSDRKLTKMIVGKYPEIKDIFKEDIISERDKVINSIVDNSLKNGAKVYDLKETSQRTIAVNVVNRKRNVRPVDLEAHEAINKIEECVDMKSHLSVVFRDLDGIRGYFSRYTDEEYLLELASNLKEKRDVKGIKTIDIMNKFDMSSIQHLFGPNIVKSGYVNIRRLELFLAGADFEGIDDYITIELDMTKDTLLENINGREDYEVLQSEIERIGVNKVKLPKFIVDLIDRITLNLNEDAAVSEEALVEDVVDDLLVGAYEPAVTDIPDKNIELVELDKTDALVVPKAPKAPVATPVPPVLPVAPLKPKGYLDVVCAQDADRIKDILNGVADDVFLKIWQCLESTDYEKSLEIFSYLSVERVVMILNASNL